MNRLEKILAEIEEVLKKVNEDHLSTIASLLVNKRIFIIGEGRSGFMGKSFAMRLMHLGADVFVVGETTTPSIAKGDLLVAISGSGKTNSVVWTAEKVKELGCEVIAVTTNLDSPLASVATEILEIPAATKYRREGESASIQPLGSLFDQSVHIVLDAICLAYSNHSQASHQDAFNRHSNLE